MRAGSIGSKVYGAYQLGYKGLTQALPSVFNPGFHADRFVLSLREVGIAAPLALFFLYHYGHRERIGAPHNKLHTFSGLAEGGIAHFLVERTSRIFPILAGGLAFYEMGRSKTIPEKIRSGIESVLLMGLGYAGVLLGLFLNDEFRSTDAKNIVHGTDDLLKKLPGNALAERARHTAEGVSSPPLRKLLQELHAKATHQLDMMKRLRAGDSNITRAQLKQATHALDEAQSAFLKAAPELKVMGKRLNNLELKQVFTTLTHHIKNAHRYKLVRMLNPSLAYLLTIALLGIPAVKLISRFLVPEAAHSAGDRWYRRQDADPFVPLYLDEVTGIRAKGAHHNYPRYTYLDV